jgi:hypothetical protein
MAEQEGIQAPEWLRTMLGQQQEMMTQMANQFSTSLATMADRISHLEEAPGLTPTPSPAPEPQVAFTEPERRVKPRLPDPERYDGVDSSLYPQFEGMLRAKLEIDGNSIGSEQEKVWYGFGRLTGAAASRVYPWINVYQSTDMFTVRHFFEQLAAAFGDPRRREKALRDLNKIQQGSRPLAEFLVDFDRLLLEAEVWGWDDRAKKAYLKSALSIRLLESLVGKEEKPTYTEFCGQLRMVNDDLTDLQEIQRRRNRSVNPHKRPPSPVPATTDQMDWQTTPAVTARVDSRKKAEWVSTTERQRRFDEHLCIRCGGEGHIQTKCNLAPPARPASAPSTDRKSTKPKRPARTAAVKSRVDPVESNSDEDSGKE